MLLFKVQLLGKLSRCSTRSRGCTRRKLCALKETVAPSVKRKSLKTPGVHLPPPSPCFATRCNSTPKITITACPPFSYRVTEEGETLSHEWGPVWRACRVLPGPLTCSHIYTVFVVTSACYARVCHKTFVNAAFVFRCAGSSEDTTDLFWLLMTLWELLDTKRRL